MKKSSGVAFGVMVCSVALISGCGKAEKSMSEKMSEKLAEKTIEMSMKDKDGTSAKVDISKGTMTIKNEGRRDGPCFGRGCFGSSRFSEGCLCTQGCKDSDVDEDAGRLCAERAVRAVGRYARFDV
jgi:hypothetical protein